MMKRLAALLLGLMMAFTFACAEETAGVPGSGDPETENYMIPRMFMSMFNEAIGISAEGLRAQFGDEETDRMIEMFSLTEYRFDGNCMYYGSADWLVQAAFRFENGEDVSPDHPCVSWYLILSDEADLYAWYLAMYSLNLMIGYTCKDTLGDEAVLEYFQTVTPGDTLELPDGYTLITYRPERDDGVVFSMQPSDMIETFPDVEPAAAMPAGEE